MVPDLEEFFFIDRRRIGVVAENTSDAAHRLIISGQRTADPDLARFRYNDAAAEALKDQFSCDAQNEIVDSERAECRRTK